LETVKRRSTFSLISYWNIQKKRIIAYFLPCWFSGESSNCICSGFPQYFEQMPQFNLKEILSGTSLHFLQPRRPNAAFRLRRVEFSPWPMD